LKMRLRALILREPFSFSVDSMTDDAVSGWAFDLARPHRTIRVNVFIDQVRVSSALADSHRRDLEQAGFGDGKHAFRISLSGIVPQQYFGSWNAQATFNGRGEPSLDICFAASDRTADKVLLSPNAAAETGPQSQGAIQTISAPVISGWAFNPAEPWASVDCTVLIDNSHVAAVVANLPNEAVGAPQDLGAGRHGFAVAIPIQYLDGGDHYVQVRTTSADLAPAIQPFNSKLFMAEGHVNGIFGLQVRGWAWFVHRPEQKVELRVTVNDEYSFAVTADQFREDLNAAEKAGGWCAFVLDIPPATLKRDVENVVRVEYAHSGRLVPQGRRVFECPASLQGIAAQYETGYRPTYEPPSGFRRRQDYFDFERAISFLTHVRTPDRQPTTYPLVSIVMPAWNRASLIAGAVESVLRQDYQNWELIIVDDGSDDGTLDVVSALTHDPRVRVTEIAHGGVSAARNAGLEASRGALIAYLDTDNRWVEHYLSTMVRVLERDSLDAVYSAMKVVGDDRVYYRCADFDWDALLDQNYIDLNVFMHTTALYSRLGGFDISLRRMVDWDLILRYTRTGAVGYAPFVGAEYDDRNDKPRISRDESKSYAFRVIDKHLIDWIGEEERITVRVAGRVSIVIPTLDNIEFTEQCVRSVLANSPSQNFEVIVVDNGGAPHTRQRLIDLAALAPYAVRIVSNPRNLNFAIGCNLGAAHSTGEYLVFLNNDTQVTKGWLDPLIEPLASHTDIRGVQPMLLYGDGTVQCAGQSFSRYSPLPFHLFQGLSMRDPLVNAARMLSSVTAACVSMRAGEFVRVRGFDPIFVNGCEDTDLCLRMIAEFGGAFRYSPESKVYHFESKTMGRLSSIALNRKVFCERWEARTPVDDEAILAHDGMVAFGYDRDVAGKGEPAIFRARPMKGVHLLATVKNILVVKPSGIGNMIMFLPALNALRRMLPDAKVTVLCFRAEAELMAGLADSVITIGKDPETGAPYREELDRAISHRHFDLAIYPPFTSVGSPSPGMRKGIRLHLVHPNVNFELRHEIEHNMDMVRMLGYVGPVSAPALDAPDAQSLPGVSDPYLAFHVGASGTSHMQRKKWPLASWAAVMEHASRSYNIVLVGGAGEEADIEGLLPLLSSRTRDKCRSVCGQLSLHATAGVLKSAAAVLTNDSGIMHLAAALDCPIVAVFGPTSATKNGPVTATAPVMVVRVDVPCGPCFADRIKLLECTDQICLSGVTPAHVTSALERVLSGNSQLAASDLAYDPARGRDQRSQTATGEGAGGAALPSLAARPRSGQIPTAAPASPD
jgi:glycosyltransferase involved in cell wall biosynthesis